MNRLIIAGSPRIDGRSAKLANQLFEACIDECPEDELAFVPLSEVNIAGCTGCGACGRFAAGDANAFSDAYGDEAVDDADENGSSELDAAPAPQKSKQALQFDHPRRCAIDDDMADVYELIDDAEEIIIVSPVYFSGPPSQLKALLDRLQPYYAKTAAARAAAAAAGETYRTAIKPAALHVVGEGSDPHGFAPLVTIVQSALAVAGFKLETVFDWVGKVAPDGEILEEADVYELAIENSDAEDEPENDEVLFDDADPASNEDREIREAKADRPVLKFDDDQVREHGRESYESGKRGGAKGRTDKRSGKGGTQTNNRNPRKENRSKSRKQTGKGGNRGKR